MFKRIILVCLIAVIAYYAGAQGLTLGNVLDWFTENDIFQISKKAIKEIFLKEGKLSGMAEAAFDETFLNATQNVAQFCYEKIEQPPLKDIKGYM